jgi:hypothetical protein
LQHALVDFAADVPFAQAREKLREHDGMDLSASTIREITERHARGCADYRDGVSTWPSGDGAGALLVEVDGSMVPIVATDAQQRDRGTGKQLLCKEAKLGLAHALGSGTGLGRHLARGRGDSRRGTAGVRRGTDAQQQNLLQRVQLIFVRPRIGSPPQLTQQIHRPTPISPENT